jgi:MoxR-like ATPase
MERHATTQAPPHVRKVVTPDQILECRKLVDGITIDRRLQEYIVQLVVATRDPARAGLPELASQIQFGASPRASMALSLCARANAFLEHRDYVTPGDVKRVALDVLRHRVIPTYEAEAEGHGSDELVARILETVPVP